MCLSQPIDDPGLVDSPLPSAGEQSGEGVNGCLVGRIITTYNQMPVQFDLFTGQVRELPVDTIQDWLARNGQNESDSFASADSYFGAAGATATQYVQTVPQCIRDQDRVADFDSCVAIFGANLQKQEQFNIPGIELNFPAKLSPSGRYLAANEFQYRYGRTSEILLMNVAEKTIIDRLNIDTGGTGPR